MTTKTRRNIGGWIQIPLPFSGLGDRGHGAEAVRVRTAERAVEAARHTGIYTVRKYDADVDAYLQRYGDVAGRERFYRENEPYEVIVSEPNLLCTDGVTWLWKCAIGLGVAPATSGTVTQAKLNTLTRYSATIGVGDGGGSLPTPSASDTDLTASTNVLYVNLDAVPVVATNSLTLTATFGATLANFSWRELATANASASVIGGSYPQFAQGVGQGTTSKISTTPGTASYSFLSHLAQDMGSKSSGSSWSVSWQCSIS